MSDEAGKMLREGGKLSILTMASRILGLVREMTRAAFMGTGILADAFAAAFTLPNFLRRLFAEGSMTAAFIPTFTGYIAEKDDEKSREFLSATFTILVVLVLAVVALGIAFAPWIVLIFKSDRSETALLTQIMFPFLALVSVAAFFQGILNSIGVFTPSGIAPILFNICWIAVPYLVGNAFGNPARAMAVGIVIGGFAQALCQLPAVLRAGWRFGFISLRRALRNPGMRRVLALIAPTILGMAAYQINFLVSSALATDAGTGALSSIQYSLRLQELVLGVFVVSLSTVLLPDLAGSAREKDWASYSDFLGRGLRAMILVTVPVALFSMVVGKDIVTLLFKAREFDAESVRLTTAAFFWHMTGLVFIAMNRVIAPAFYACSDTKTPTWAGVVSFGANIVLAVFLVGPMKGPGIALALSVASAVNTLVLVAVLLRRNIPGASRAVFAAGRYFLKMLAFSVLAVAPILFARAELAHVFGRAGSRLVSAGLPLLLDTIVFVVIGIGLLALSKDEMAGMIVSSIRRRRGGTRST
jgi:putative peptidoglycan lipid II flippase